MIGKAFVERLKRAKEKRGLSALPMLAVKKFRGTVRDKWRVVFNDQNHVFVYDGEPPEVTLPEGITIESYANLQDIPQAALGKFIDEKGEKSKSWLSKEFAEKSVLWLLFVNGEFVVRQFIRHGRFYDRWFLPLADEDFVFLAAGTFPEFRGRGLNPLLKRSIMAREMKSGGRAFVDCKIWNKSAIRALEKNHFRHLGIMKNYWEGETIKERSLAVFKKLINSG